MPSEASDVKHIPVSVTADESHQQDNVIISNPPDMAPEADHQTDADLNPPKSSVVENLSSLDLDLKRQEVPEGDIDINDNDSAKAGLDDSTDDEHGLPSNQDIDSDISTARKRHMERLADIYSQMEQVARDHDNVIESVFRTKINSLTKTLQEGDQERAGLAQLVQQKDVEMGALRHEMALENERHKDELSQQKRLAEEERIRAGKEWERELHEAMQKRGLEHQQAMESQHQEHHQAMEHQSQEHQAAMEQRQQEHEKALAFLREEMKKESEQRVSNLLEEAGRETEQQVNKVRAEMDSIKVELEREMEQTMKEMRSEMARLVEREREARERCKRLEMALNPKGIGQGQGHNDPQTGRPPLHQSSSWAIARLWGVGQTRARSFS